MTQIITKMPPPEGAAAGQTATIRLPLGYTYNRLMIYMEDGSGAIAEADWGSNLGDIRLLVDGDAKIEVDAADLVALNNYYGHTHDDGILPIFLARQWARTPQGEDVTGYGTGSGVGSLTLEIDVKSGITLGTLAAYAKQAAPQPWGPHLRLRRLNENVGATGQVDISTLPRGPFVTMAAHLKGGSVTDVQAFSNDRKVFDTSAAIREQHDKIGGYTPQSGWAHVNFLNEARIGEAVPMNVNDFRIRATFGGTGAVPIYLENIEAPGAFGI